MIQPNDYLITHATNLAKTAAQVAHEAAPYPQDGDVFKGLSALANAFSAAALRCLNDAIEPEKASDTDATPTVEADMAKAKSAVPAPADSA